MSSTKVAKRRGPGRPSKFNPALVTKICDAIADGVPLHYAATLAGVAVSSLHVWKERHPDFAVAIEKARAFGLHETLKVITVAAKTDWRAAAWYLEHVHPEHFARNRLEVSGPDGAALQAGSNVVIVLPAKREVSLLELNGTSPAIEATKNETQA